MRLKSLEKTVDAINMLPSIGRKGAVKIAQALIENPKLREELLDAIDSLSIIHECPVCGSLTESEDECEICISANRDRDKICVVHGNADMMSLEESGYNGLYHVMDRLIDSEKRVGPSDTNMGQLLLRLDDISEVILALPHSHEGEQTSIAVKLLIDSYLLNRGGDQEILVTRNATGISRDESLSFSTIESVQDSMSNRKEFK